MPIAWARYLLQHLYNIAQCYRLLGGAVAIGLGVGLDVGLSQSSGSTFPLLRFGGSRRC